MRVTPASAESSYFVLGLVGTLTEKRFLELCDLCEGLISAVCVISYVSQLRRVVAY